MFGKLKEKLKSWFKKSEEKAVEEPEKEKKPAIAKAEKGKKIKEKPAKELKETKKQIKEEKTEKKDISKKAIEEEKKRAEEHKDEREVSEKIEEDIEEEKHKKEQKIEQELKEAKEQIKEEKTEKKGFFSKLFNKFKFHIDEAYFNEIFEELEIILLENNVAYEVVEKIKQNLSQELIGKEVEKSKVEQEIKKALKLAIEGVLIDPFSLVERVKENKKYDEPYVILFFGINGTGKTTTIAKTANMLKEKGFSVVLAAADTFRAASIEQLGEHAKRLSVEMIKSQYNADPASVAFDAIKHAKAIKADVVLIDTAGRMHTKESLMKEMEKIVRVTKPTLKIFIGESITGNDAIEQARIFNESIGIDAIILSKADVDDKGGTALSVSYITGKPILFLGVGQEYKDLKPFKKSDFIESLGL